MNYGPLRDNYLIRLRALEFYNSTVWMLLQNRTPKYNKIHLKLVGAIWKVPLYPCDLSEWEEKSQEIILRTLLDSISTLLLLLLPTCWLSDVEWYITLSSMSSKGKVEQQHVLVCRCFRCVMLGIKLNLQSSGGKAKLMLYIWTTLKPQTFYY